MNLDPGKISELTFENIKDIKVVSLGKQKIQFQQLAGKVVTETSK